MLSISEKLMHSTIRIEVLNKKNDVVSTGTGFFFSFSIEEKNDVPVIITNKHVVEGANRGRLVFTVGEENNPKYGEKFRYIMEGFEQMFIPHPEKDVDLCIIPLAQIHLDARQRFNKELVWIPLDETHIPSKEQIESLSALEDITMIGYPNGLWDSTNNLPIMRKGVTAIHPKFDYNGKTDIVMDIASFPGSSGSPVCIYNQGSYTQGNGIVMGTRFMLLGVLYAGPQQTVTGEIVTVTIPTSNKRDISVSNVMINIGYAVKSRRILDFKPILANLLKTTE